MPRGNPEISSHDPGESPPLSKSWPRAHGTQAEIQGLPCPVTQHIVAVNNFCWCNWMYFRVRQMNSVGEQWRFFLQNKAEYRTLNYISLCVCVFVYMCVRMWACAATCPSSGRDHGKTCWSWYTLPASMWVGDTELTSGVVAGVFLCRSSSLPRKQNF